MKRWLLTYILTENLKAQHVPKPRQNPDDFASPPWPQEQRPLRGKTAGKCGSDCSRPAKRRPGQNLCAPELLLPPGPGLPHENWRQRSEERRVGKECRSRWWAERLKIKESVTRW